MKDDSKNRKSFRVVCLGFAAIYLALTIGATIYAQTGYRDNLPVVIIGKAEQGRLPMDCIEEGEDGYNLSIVEQQDGPWGKQYIVKKIHIMSYRRIGEDRIQLLNSADYEKPIIFSFSSESISEGQIVRIGGKAQ